MGDEPAMLKKNLPGIPVIVDKDRMRAAAKAALEYRADTVVLDDGMQQWGIKKDLEVVAVDSGNPFGNRCLIPRGILREPLSALRRADIFVLTKTNLYPHSADTLSFLRGVNPVAEVFCAEHAAAGFYTLGKEAEMLPVQSLQGKAAAAFCGIGDPESFKKALCALGARTELFYSFPDHYQYRAEDLRRISAEAAQRGIDILVTTEKDAARLANLQLTTYNLQLVFVLRIQLRMINEQRFLNRLSGIYLP
jgi:tetraacyldisaccharide 4'-kinase